MKQAHSSRVPTVGSRGAALSVRQALSLPLPPPTPAMASPLAAAIPQATTSGDLADLLAVSSPAKVHPTDDAILAVLTPRFRADLPYARIGSTALVVVNPCKALANVNDASAKEYEERCYKDTRLGLADSRRPPQPHLYEQAAKIYLLMRRRLESQAVVAR